jgi:replicative DNA helicase
VNEFDSDLVSKKVAEIEQKEKNRKLADAVRYHENTQKLKKIADGKKFTEGLTDVDFTTDFDALSDAAAEDDLARMQAIEFMFEDLNDFIQLAPGSLALIAAATGTGKSTLTANIAYGLLRQGKRVLIIANEEKRTDVAARISCLQLDVSIHLYKKKDGLPHIIKENVLSNIRNFDSKQLSIIALDYRNDQRYVTSPEGMEALLNNAKGKFDAVIVDYYQNINHSVNNPGLQAHEANEIFAKRVDNIKNEIGCPIILMAQMRRGDEEYKERLEGRRLILNKCTDVFEIAIDKAHRRTMITCWKDRWLGNQGEMRYVGYKNGKYVPYTREFEDGVKNELSSQLDSMASNAENV